MKTQTKRMPTNFPIGTKVRDIYTGKVSTVKGLEWQSYAGGDTSDYTVEFVEGGWNKSTNLEKVTWPEPTQTEQRDLDKETEQIIAIERELQTEQRDTPQDITATRPYHGTLRTDQDYIDAQKARANQRLREALLEGAKQRNTPAELHNYVALAEKLDNLKAHAERLAEALKEAANSLNDELMICGDEEIKEHPMLAKHKRVYRKAEAALAQWEGAQK